MKTRGEVGSEMIKEVGGMEWLTHFYVRKCFIFEFHQAVISLAYLTRLNC